MLKKPWGGGIQEELWVVEHACWSRPAADFVEVLKSYAERERGDIRDRVCWLDVL